MKNRYKFCSICGSKLKPSRGNLSCLNCLFVNYQNPRPTVTALVFRNNKLLFVKRNNNPFKGWWDLPGGFIDKGEGPEKALHRELKEEMGLRIRIKRLVGIYPDIYEDEFDPCHTISIVYLVEPVGSINRVDKRELKSAGWLSKKEIPQRIAFDSNRKIIKDFLKIWR